MLRPGLCCDVIVRISPARRIAFEVLRRVEAEDAYSSDALHDELNDRITPADAALATELTMGVLRWRGLLDFLIERISTKRIAQLDMEVAIALRLGLYQLRYLQKIPAHAAVHESVEIVKHARKTSAAPFVNAVLRKALKHAAEPAERLLDAQMAPIERMAILHSHPAWLVGRWLTRLGEANTIALLEANNRAPSLACALHDLKDRQGVFEEFATRKLRIADGKLLQRAFSVSGGSVSRTDAFAAGRISIQDEASQAVALLLGVKLGDKVLDLCAAPGGKTAILARVCGDHGFVFAGDIHLHRLRATRAQLARQNIRNAALIALDAAKPLPFRGQFDRILVDAPCSGTGTLARHPEIRWRLKPTQLAELHQLQVAILRNAIASASPGAKILYSTCSMEPEENEAVIDEVLSTASGHTANVRRANPDDARKALAPHLAPQADPQQLFDESGAFRTLPFRDGTDGFFAALLEKAAA